MEWGKNSGLGILQLRAQGVTGQGVNAAVIDGPLLTEHQEYADRLQLYEEINILDPKWEAAPHGSAVASLALGKTVGVAPEANLYYVAMWPSDKSRSEDFITTFTT